MRNYGYLTPVKDENWRVGDDLRIIYDPELKDLRFRFTIYHQKKEKPAKVITAPVGDAQEFIFNSLWKNGVRIRLGTERKFKVNLFSPNSLLNKEDAAQWLWKEKKHNFSKYFYKYNIFDSTSFYIEENKNALKIDYLVVPKWEIARYFFFKTSRFSKAIISGIHADFLNQGKGVIVEEGGKRIFNFKFKNESFDRNEKMALGLITKIYKAKWESKYIRNHIIESSQKKGQKNIFVGCNYPLVNQVDQLVIGYLQDIQVLNRPCIALVVNEILDFSSELPFDSLMLDDIIKKPTETRDKEIPGGGKRIVAIKPDYSPAKIEPPDESIGTKNIRDQTNAMFGSKVGAIKRIREIPIEDKTANGTIPKNINGTSTGDPNYNGNNIAPGNLEGNDESQMVEKLEQEKYDIIGWFQGFYSELISYRDSQLDRSGVKKRNIEISYIELPGELRSEEKGVIFNRKGHYYSIVLELSIMNHYFYFIELNQVNTTPSRSILCFKNTHLKIIDDELALLNKNMIDCFKAFGSVKFDQMGGYYEDNKRIFCRRDLNFKRFNHRIKKVSKKEGGVSLMHDYQGHVLKVIKFCNSQIASV